MAALQDEISVCGKLLALNKMALAALIMICLIFGAGFALTTRATVYMETVKRQQYMSLYRG